ncbi:MAG: type I-C CRISPR-associated protein Cas8c/Csd1 [Candidatus Binatia bacterium]
MSWLQKLYETYEQCAGAPQFANNQLLPVSYTVQQAHIEITIDDHGNFLRAAVIPKEETILPATEDSAGRTSGEAPHPLSDKIQYCAADYPKYGGKKKFYYPGYVKQLSAWCQSKFSHPKVKAVLEYVRKGTVVADLIHEKILHLGKEGKLLTTWRSDAPVPQIFKNLTAKAGERDQGDALIRWRVETQGEPLTATWEDQSLAAAWIGFDASQNPTQGLCMVTGKEMLLAKSHPRRLRRSGDGAKLISSNDTDGFTFRGRFVDADQACGVGFDVTQKAHNALRWLIGRQAFRNGDQVVVAWAVSGKQIPDPFANSHELFGIETEEKDGEPQFQGDAGQAFGRRLARLIAGYRAELGSTNEIVVMGLDSATPGRMGITFYRELTGSELLDRIQSWHENVAWHQHYSKEIRFVGAPSPKEIAEAAFGHRLDDKLRKATVERLLPCIIDGQAIPRDLMESTVRRTCNRVGLENWEFEKNLGITCALFRGYFNERSYQMALEPNRITRDYLYGRLLAIAEHIEGRALHLAGEKRDTSAAKLMQRFADRPHSTWRTIELSLSPYKTRLRAKRPSFLNEMEKQLDEVIGAFQERDFMDDRRLSGEFLLGYHCQRQALWTKPEPETNEENTDN